MILVAHIEVSPGYRATGPFGRLRLLVFKINLHAALTVLFIRTVPLTVGIVTAIAIHFTDCRLQIMQVGFDTAIVGIFAAIFAAAVLPALTLMAELPGGHHVFPLDTCGAVGIFARLVATAVQIRLPLFAVPGNFTATVKAAGRIVINLCGVGFCLLKIILMIVVEV
ncbi:hypothetical protein PAJ_2442 [Pantoea ananatis AJ13355]|uniref:Uncharacterized protein n=1 Tax=Pantoea ananatis (strain AJ13355) TaxID=932677 RepID=A0A0H3L3S3_PANAA|nr:hypothetical protein PAJ_2442 [Pantoea ananatis AJ13355]